MKTSSKLVGISIAVLVIIILSNLFSKSNKTEKSVPLSVAPIGPSSKEVSPASQDVNQNVVRKAKLDPSRQYLLSFFYIDDQEIARIKSKDHVIYAMEGKIPDGPVHFTDETRQTYGEENFKDGKWEGWFREYYKDGQLAKEIFFKNGAMMTVKEYFFDGTLRMEADYSDALFATKEKNKGMGKIYYRDGSLMYEWCLTNLDDRKFNRSFNTEGKLVEENIFNGNGELVESKHPQDKPL